MEKLLIGAIAALILLALIPIKDTTTTAINADMAITTVSNDIEEPETVLVQLNEIDILDSSEPIIAQSTEIENIANSEIEIDQETADSDRVVFISIGSMILIGILLMLTPLRKI